MRLLAASAVFLILALSVVAAFGTAADRENLETETIRVIESKHDGESERVTVAIPVEQGAEIGLETSRSVKIDSWDGDEVLLIVERVRKPGRPRIDLAANPMDIQISRSGKDVEIRALNEFSTQGVDVSFRVLLPRSYAGQESTIRSTYDLHKLTSVVLGALQKEAIRWVIR